MGTGPVQLELFEHGMVSVAIQNADAGQSGQELFIDVMSELGITPGFDTSPEWEARQNIWREAHSAAILPPDGKVTASCRLSVARIAPLRPSS